MALRDRINQHPAVVTRATVAVIVLALIMIVYQQRGLASRPRPAYDPAAQSDRPVGDDSTPGDDPHAPPNAFPGHAANAAPRPARPRPQHHRTTPEIIA